MRQKRHLKTNGDREFNKIIAYSIPLVILIILTIIFLSLYINNRNGKYVSYKETSDVNYKVYLNENDFYENEFLEENQQYVSGLIKNIVADFTYNMNVDNKLDYACSYKVDAVVNVIDKNTKNTLYKHTETLVEEKNIESKYNKIDIAENVKIDFNHFNNIANDYITAYSLSSSSESTLTVKLIVNNNKTEETTTTLSIPLTKQTIAINKNTKLAEDNNNQLLMVGSTETIKKVSILGLVFSLTGAFYFAYKLIDYLKETMSDENKYKNEIKKIILNYGEYINKTEDYEFKLDEYEIVRVQTFLELIKIKEDLSRPILMIENNQKTSTMFAITDNTKFIYLFAINLHQELLAEKNESYEDEKEKVGVGNYED